MSDNEGMTLEPSDHDQRHRLSEEMGKFLLAFSKLEGTLAYYNSMLLFRDTRHDDEGRIIAAHMSYRQKVSMFRMLCNHIGLSEAKNSIGSETFRLRDVVKALEEAGQARNRIAHDEMEASSYHDSARVFKLRRKGDPHGDGWMSFIELDDIKRYRESVESTRELLTSFTLAADKAINPRS